MPTLEQGGGAIGRRCTDTNRSIGIEDRATHEFGKAFTQPLRERLVGILQLERVGIFMEENVFASHLRHASRLLPNLFGNDRNRASDRPHEIASNAVIVGADEATDRVQIADQKYL